MEVPTRADTCVARSKDSIVCGTSVPSKLLVSLKKLCVVMAKDSDVNQLSTSSEES